MKVKHSIAIKRPTSIRVDIETRDLLKTYLENEDTFNTMLHRKFRGGK
jgi:hypothetical protein